MLLGIECSPILLILDYHFLEVPIFFTEFSEFFSIVNNRWLNQQLSHFLKTVLYFFQFLNHTPKARKFRDLPDSGGIYPALVILAHEDRSILLLPLCNNFFHIVWWV